MPTNMSLGRDINGFVTYGLTFSDQNTSTTLAANTAQTVTVPANVTDAIFSYNAGGNVWVANNSGAAVPGGSFSATASVLNPVARKVNGGDVLSFVTSDTTAFVSIVYYIRGQ